MMKCPPIPVVSADLALYDSSAKHCGCFLVLVVGGGVGCGGGGFVFVVLLPYFFTKVNCLNSDNNQKILGHNRNASTLLVNVNVILNLHKRCTSL